MTTDELKKEAEEYATHNDWFEFSANVDEIGNAIRTKMERAYIASAKPREKRIAELEQENENLKKTYLKQRNKRIDDLQKENAELRKLKRECETSLCRAEYQYNYEQLTKAKEIIKKLVEAIHIWDCKNLEEVEAEAEQFLSEVEK